MAEMSLEVALETVAEGVEGVGAEGKDQVSHNLDLQVRAEADTLAKQLWNLYRAPGTLCSTLSDCTGALKCDQIAYDPQWRTRPELAFHGQQVPIRFHRNWR